MMVLRQIIILYEVCLLIQREWLAQHRCDLAAKDSGLECTCVNNDDFTVLVSGGGRCHWVSICTVCPLHSKWLSTATNLQRILLCVKLEHYSAETVWMIQKATAVGNWWLAVSSQCTCCTMSCAEILVKQQITQVSQPLSSPDLAPCDFWLIPKLKSPLIGERFQNVSQWDSGNTMGQLMAIGRTVWGVKVPTWRGLRPHCLMYNVSCTLYLLQ